MKRVKITVLKTTLDRELAEEYGAEGLTACPMLREEMCIRDRAKGVEAQTRKLFKVCAMRDIPIFTFINKMDREARDSFELLEELEKELGIETYPVNWPIGCGKDFKGVYDLSLIHIS